MTAARFLFVMLNVSQAFFFLAGKCAKELNHKIWRERIAIQRRSALDGKLSVIYG